jgi:hypothetical protein
VLLERFVPCGVAFGAYGVQVVLGAQFGSPARLQFGQALQARLQQSLAHGGALLLDAFQREGASLAQRLGGRRRFEAGQRRRLWRGDTRLRRQRRRWRRRGRKRNRLRHTHEIHPHARRLRDPDRRGASGQGRAGVQSRTASRF